MRFSTQPHHAYCGIDLHARTLSLCIVHHHGKSLVHHHYTATSEPFLTGMAPLGTLLSSRSHVSSRGMG